jgi:hypothetical protein
MAGFVPGVQSPRVVTLADGVTVHNAFPDRGFTPSTGTNEGGLGP